MENQTDKNYQIRKNFIKNYPITKEKKVKIKLFEQHNNKIIVIQLKSGILVEGTPIKEDLGFITVKNAIITGKDYIGESEWICIERTQISHFHPKLTNLKLKG